MGARNNTMRTRKHMVSTAAAMALGGLVAADSVFAQAIVNTNAVQNALRAWTDAVNTSVGLQRTIALDHHATAGNPAGRALPDPPPGWTVTSSRRGS